MKLQTTTNEVSTEGLAEVSNFRIAVNGKAFRILLDGLYANKIGAVVRELCTNAFDAHAAVNKGSTPFKVHLPTVFDPTFSVRDYGVSMTHEQVFTLYTTVFESSKDASNAQVGMLGLGSKSPFAYADNFSVTAWKDGKKRTYSAFIGGDGIPQIALFSEEDSTEETGIEVSLAVQARDCQAFGHNAAKILRWFPTPPLVEGGRCEFPKEDIKDSGNGWKLLNLGYYDRHGAMARQGCVVYPLDSSAIPNVTTAHKSLLGSPLVIDFPIGSLNVAANRESLSYDAHTCKNILARLNSLTKEIADKHSVEILAAPTLWEAGRLYREFASSALPKAIIEAVGTVKYNNTYEVKGGIKASDIENEICNAYPAVTPDPANPKPLEEAAAVSFHFADRYRCNRRTSYTIDYNTESCGNRKTYNYGEPSIFYVRVVGKHPTYEGVRIQQDYETQKAASKTQIEGITLIVVRSEEIAKKVIAKLGNPPFKYTHELDKVEIARDGTPKLRGTTKKTQVKVRTIARDTYNNWNVSAETVVDLDGDAYYVLTQESRVLDVDGKKHSLPSDYDEHKAFDAAEALGILPKGAKFYAVSIVYQKRVEECDTWINLTSLIKDKIEPYKQKAIEVETAWKIGQELYSSSTWGAVCDTVYKMLEKTKTGPLYEYSLVTKDHKSKLSLYQNSRYSSRDRESTYVNDLRTLDPASVNKYFEDVTSGVDVSATLVTIQAAAKACKVRYPIIESSGVRNTKHLSDYVEAMDLLYTKRAAEELAKVSAAPNDDAAPVVNFLTN